MVYAHRQWHADTHTSWCGICVVRSWEGSDTSDLRMAVHHTWCGVEKGEVARRRPPSASGVSKTRVMWPSGASASSILTFAEAAPERGRDDERRQTRAATSPYPASKCVSNKRKEHARFPSDEQQHARSRVMSGGRPPKAASARCGAAAGPGGSRSAEAPPTAAGGICASCFWTSNRREHGTTDNRNGSVHSPKSTNARWPTGDLSNTHD